MHGGDSVRFTVLHHLEAAEGGVPDGDIYAEVADQVRAADELGFAIAWVAEHHFTTERGRAPAPLLFLVHLAARTPRIRLGSAVLPAPFYHPLRLAESVAMADVLTGGRLECGISSSGIPDEMRVFGVPQEGKHDRLRDTLLWLRRAWSGQEVAVSSPGRTPDTDGASGHSPPVTIVPSLVQRVEDMVWVAASTEGAAQVAGELGHHLLLPSLRPVASSAKHVAVYRAALAGGGLDAASRKIQNTFHLVIDEDHGRAMRIAEPIMRAYYEGYVRGGAVGRLEDESPAAIMDRINFVAGGPEAVAEQLARARDALGLTHIAFQSRLNGLSHRQALLGLELVMTRVAPLLASTAHTLPQSQHG
jgi:alkanesulfonate monooxygenase SsuD/methylene tetrahydromethanopterin reductase-like flavin-dependent oxidoreductase (luciferase family)